MFVRSLAVVAAALVLAGPAAACAKPRASLTALEGQVMCPTCHTTLDQSDSAVAGRIRAYISRRVDQCATAGQIKQELVAQFGQSILAAPPRKGFDLLAWWLPIAGILVAASAIGVGAWRWSRAREPEPPERLDPESERRVDEALAGFDG
ncbi:MAG TPA: cytochrome c-type biogenesis protein CcmH [Gaiellaceae bacterium]|jgi:cytochrome c-type biogenesis protein CcmH